MEMMSLHVHKQKHLNGLEAHWWFDKTIPFNLSIIPDKVEMKSIKGGVHYSPQFLW